MVTLCYIIMLLLLLYVSNLLICIITVYFRIFTPFSLAFTIKSNMIAPLLNTVVSIIVTTKGGRW